MAYYTTEFGGRFDTYDEAVEACLCDQEMDDFEDYFSRQVSYTKLLNWALEQEKFFNDFGNEIDKANQEFLDDCIREWDDEDEGCHEFEPGKYYVNMFELNP